MFGLLLEDFLFFFLPWPFPLVPCLIVLQNNIPQLPSHNPWWPPTQWPFTPTPKTHTHTHSHVHNGTLMHIDTTVQTVHKQDPLWPLSLTWSCCKQHVWVCLCAYRSNSHVSALWSLIWGGSITITFGFISSSSLQDAELNALKGPHYWFCMSLHVSSLKPHADSFHVLRFCLQYNGGKFICVKKLLLKNPTAPFLPLFLQLNSSKRRLQVIQSSFTSDFLFVKTRRCWVFQQTHLLMLVIWFFCALTELIWRTTGVISMVIKHCIIRSHWIIKTGFKRSFRKLTNPLINWFILK